MRILLVGAGFTRNWGGLLASDFTGELCGRLTDQPHLNEMLRVENDFESVFGQRRAVAQREPENSQAAEDVRRLDAAIAETFREMNGAIAARNVNFSQEARCLTKRFLSRFDAIFSLNQDLFFELHYDSMPLESDGKWDGHCFPGVVVSPEYAQCVHTIDRVGLELAVEDDLPGPQNRCQPIYKLHGSSNWRNAQGDRVLIIGTGKEQSIAGSHLLRRYHETFREHLCRGATGVMVIGYGFADPHINSLLLEGARTQALTLYLVNTSGRRALDAHQGRSHGRNELLEIPLAGESTRTLAETFLDSENVAFRSFERFLGR